jgi:hypothetical protein
MTRARKHDTTLCRNTCIYYKPGKNEDMMCQGFVVVHTLLQSGKKLPLARPADAPKPGAETIDELRRRICAVCAFRVDGCDFVLTGGEAVPCGGFSLLSYLVESGDVTLTEIEGAP